MVKRNKIFVVEVFILTEILLKVLDKIVHLAYMDRHIVIQAANDAYVSNIMTKLNKVLV